MGGDGVFLANVSWEREGSWEIGVSEAPSKAAGGGSRTTIPGARRGGGQGGREVGEDRAGEEGERGEALARLRGGDKGAGSAEHLLGGQGQLLDGPAVEVEITQGACGDGQGRGQHQGL